MRHAAPALAFGSWGWIWDAMVVRSIKWRDKPEDEGWFSWHTRSLRDAQQWVIGQLCCPFDEWLLRKGATKREETLQRHEIR